MRNSSLFLVLFSLACGDGATLVANRAPAAFAGFDQRVEKGAQVRLDGSHSFDADGNGLTYAWTLVGPGASHAALAPQTGAHVTLQGADDFAGAVVVSLVVHDGAVASEPDWLTVHFVAAAELTRPVASAGDNLHVRSGQPLVLDASASQGSIDAYRWSHLSASDGMLRSIGADRTALLTDLAPGLHVFGLTVASGAQWSAMDCVSVWVDAEERQDPFPLVTIAERSVGTATLVATSPSEVVWSLVSGPDGSSEILAGQGDNNSRLEYRSVSVGLHLFAATLENGLADWVALDMENTP